MFVVRRGFCLARMLITAAGVLLAAQVGEPVTQLAWGGGGDGRALALVAAAGSRVFLLSLQPFVDRQGAFVPSDVRALQNVGNTAAGSAAPDAGVIVR